jgi:hypothetical protein
VIAPLQAQHAPEPVGKFWTQGDVASPQGSRGYEEAAQRLAHAVRVMGKG